MISNLGLSMLLLAASSAGAVDRPPSAGGYGFNWLAPETASCKKLEAKDLAKAKCTVSSNAFGLDIEAHACKVSDRVELIVYKTAAQCQQGLETMQANGD